MLYITINCKYLYLDYSNSRPSTRCSLTSTIVLVSFPCTNYPHTHTHTETSSFLRASSPFLLLLVICFSFTMCFYFPQIRMFILYLCLCLKKLWILHWIIRAVARNLNLWKSHTIILWGYFWLLHALITLREFKRPYGIVRIEPEMAPCKASTFLALLSFQPISLWGAKILTSLPPVCIRETNKQTKKEQFPKMCLTTPMSFSVTERKHWGLGFRISKQKRKFTGK